ncbi:MAG: alpha-amylase family glycosyl hydrolase [Elusimicrobiales bacterium]|nr:alpha-amylase family glycosyl hydrolase [Elusimicrobiales bacterium]
MGLYRLLLSSISLLLLTLPPGVLASGPEAERSGASALFDGNSPLPAPEGTAAGKERDASADFLRQMKEVLSTGAWDGPSPKTRHFIFRNSGEGWTAQAQSVGLEGFLWTKKELEGKYGEAAFSGQLNDYFLYLDGLLKPASWTGELRAALSELKNSQLPDREKNARLNAILENYVSGLQANMERYDGAAWAKKARIYELFPRAYNLDGRRSASGFKSPSEPSKTLFFREFGSSDFEVIKRMGFDTVWPMGILPIGVRGQTGTGGGSPYSISDHGTVNPDLGTEKDFSDFVKKAHQAGLKVIVDFVVNHTSLDSRLLAENPDYFVSFRYDGPCPKDGYFESYWNGGKYCVHHGGFEYGNGVSSWIDTAQVNYSNTALRARMTDTVKGWVTKFDVDGFRVDMAYLALNNVFARTWQKSMPHEEFYRQLIWTVKAAKPSAAFMAEAYAYQEDLGACGFDTIYSKQEDARPEGQTGWYNSTEAGSAAQIQSALNRQAFLAWQTGGAGSVMFIGNHDEPAPEKIYGKRLPAALALTLLYPGSVMMYSGAEIGYDAAVPAEHKPLPFSVPAEVDWNGGDPAVKNTYKEALALAARVRAELGDYEIEPLWPAPGQAWAGYILKSKAKPGMRRAIIGNITWNGTAADVPQAGFSGRLEPGEYRLLELR